MRDFLGPALTTLAFASGAAAPCALADEIYDDTDGGGATSPDQASENTSQQWLVGDYESEPAPQYDTGLMSSEELASPSPHTYRGPRIPVPSAYAAPLA